MHVGGELYKWILKSFYYDEQTEMYELMKKEQDEHEQSLSVEEREKNIKNYSRKQEQLWKEQSVKRKKNIRLSIL